MIERYSFEDWLHYGKRGKLEYSCFRFYSVGLNRGMPLVFLDALKKIGFGGLFAWLATLFAEKLLTDGKLPWILDYLGTYTTKEIFTFLLIVICLVAIWIAVHSIRQGFRYVSVLDKLQSLNYQVENQTQSTDVNLGELATICCDGVASCFQFFAQRPE